MRLGNLFQTSLFLRKQVVSTLFSIYLDSPQHRNTKETSCVNFKLLIQRFDQFSFLKGSGTGHFVYIFFRKTFFLLYSINWPDFIVWLLLLLELLGNICIEIICFLVYLLNFEIIPSFLMKSFFYTTKKVSIKT